MWCPDSAASECRWNGGIHVPFQLASARVHPLPPQHADRGIQEEEILCVFRVRESNPSSYSWQKASCMSFQQAADVEMPAYTIVYVGIWYNVQCCTHYSLETERGVR